MRFKNDAHTLWTISNIDEYLEKDEECTYRPDDQPKKKPSIAVIIVLSGFAVLIVSALLFYEQINSFMVHGNHGLDMIFIMLGLILGLALIVYLTHIVRYTRLMMSMNKCTETVDATIVMVKLKLEKRGRNGGYRKLFFPVYSYYFEGKYYIAESDDEDFSIRPFDDPSLLLGTTRPIAIDPDSPYTVNTNTESKLALAKMGSYVLSVGVLIFTAIAIFCIIAKHS